MIKAGKTYDLRKNAEIGMATGVIGDIVEKIVKLVYYLFLSTFFFPIFINIILNNFNYKNSQIKTDWSESDKT